MYPSSSVGGWRGSTGISGPSAEGTAARGMPQQGTAGLSIGTGSVQIGGSDWHPSVLYLLALVIVELFVFAWLAKLLG